MTKKATRSTAFDEALAKVRKSRGLAIGSLDEVLEEVEGISTGNLALDWITGCWGLPKGRIVELYGLQSSGKTTTALQAAATAQQAGLNVVFLDYEHSLDPTYCAALGLDPYDPSFVVSQPTTFEEGINAIRDLVPSGEVGMVIVDSVAAMVTEKEMELDTGSESDFGRKQKMMAQSMRQLGPDLRKNGTSAVFLNHVRDVIDTSAIGRRLAGAGIERKTTPGGTALKYHSSMRLHFKSIGKVTAEGTDALTTETSKTKVAEKVTVVVEKNKVGPPFRKAELRLRYGKGFSSAWTVLQILVAHGGIKKKSGGMYDFGEYGGVYRGEETAIAEVEKEYADLEVAARQVLEASAAEWADAALAGDEELPDKFPEAEADEVDALLEGK
jgi:recombination protein RecA